MLRISSRRASISLVCLWTLAVFAAGCGGSGSSGGGAPAASSTAAATSAAPASTTTSSSSPPVASPPAAPAQPAQPLAGAWYKGDLHSHSATHSEDARRQLGDDVATTVRVAEQTGLDFLAGTDHRTNALLTDPNFSSQSMVLLPGMEWGSSMHAGAIGYTSPIQVAPLTSGALLTPEIEGIVADVQAQGGIFVLNHPCEKGKLWAVDLQSFDAIEVWNGPFSMRDYQPLTQQDLDDQARRLGIAAPNPHLGAGISDQRGGPQLQAVGFYESYLNSGRRVAAVGGGDRHMLLPQGSPTTRVYAQTRDKQGILAGIRAGRTYVTRTPQGPLVDFRADRDRDGVFESLIGDEVQAGAGADFRVVIEGAPGGRVDVIKRGVVIRSEAIVGNTFLLTFQDVPAAGDWYRLDVFEKVDPQVQRTTGLFLRVAQASGQDWAVLLALVTRLPRTALDLTFGTLLPTLIIPDEIDKVLNASLKDPGYCRGAITSPIYTSR